MPKISALIGAIVLAFVVLCAPNHAARAFGLQFGPLRLELPGSGYHRRSRPLAQPPDAGNPQAAEQPRDSRPTLLYPLLVWQSLEDAIFWPDRRMSWPFDYKTIFDQAFAKYPAEQSADLCPYRDSATGIVGRIQRDIQPTAAQRPLLQKLATALGQANGYLVKSCPRETSLRPVARLEFMQTQIDAMIMALEIIRPPLQQFEKSLDENQRARWAEGAPATDDDNLACNGKAETADWPLSQLERAVQPTEVQRQALAHVEAAFKRAASGLAAECAAPPQQTVWGRLEMTEDRLDATWRAVQTIEVALTDFQKDLSDEQKARINALEIASTR
jgi:hypothetical protein